MTAPTPPPSSGRIGRYRIVERLAIGGMAEVFLAEGLEGTRAGERVVIKRILPHLVDDANFVHMFMQEARIAQRIRHPNVVALYELDEQGGYPYLVLEYVPGASLRELQRAAARNRERLPLGVALHLVMQACAGAHAAHESHDADGRPIEIVHRDLTPHNLMVTPTGEVKVLDFGIAKATEGMDHTRTGVLKGKIAYMSPEQCLQKPLDRRSDLFALGIVAWELLGGLKMFRDKSELNVMQAIVGGDIPQLHRARADVPMAVAKAVHRALAVDRADRPATADLFRRDLERAAQESGVRIDPSETAATVQALLPYVPNKRTSTASSEANEPIGYMAPPGLGEEITRATVGRGTGVTRPLVAGARPGANRHTVQTWAAAALGGVIGSFLVSLVLVGWLAAAFAPEISEAFTEAAPDYPGPPVVLTFPPVYQDRLEERELPPLARYLESKLKRQVRIELADSYGDAADKVVQGEVHFAALPPFTYISAVDENPGTLTPIAMKLHDATMGSGAHLVVRQDIPPLEGDFTKLRGTVFCYPDEKSTSGNVLPRAFLAEQGLDVEADFAALRVSGNHGQLLQDLHDGACDVAGTYTNNLMNHPQRASVREVARTGRAPHDMLVAGPAADEALADAVRRALLTFNPRDLPGSPAYLGDEMHITGFVAGDDTAYDPLRDKLVAAGVWTPSGGADATD